MMIGIPVSSRVLASRPPLRSYCSTWLLTHSHGLASYSPSIVMHDKIRVPGGS